MTKFDQGPKKCRLTITFWPILIKNTKMTIFWSGPKNDQFWSFLTKTYHNLPDIRSKLAGSANFGRKTKGLQPGKMSKSEHFAQKCLNFRQTPFCREKSPFRAFAPAGSLKEPADGKNDYLPDLSFLKAPFFRRQVNLAIPENEPPPKIPIFTFSAKITLLGSFLPKKRKTHPSGVLFFGPSSLDSPSKMRYFSFASVKMKMSHFQEGFKNPQNLNPWVLPFKSPKQTPITCTVLEIEVLKPRFRVLTFFKKEKVSPTGARRC